MLITLIKQHCFSSLLEIHFNDGSRRLIAYELLRIYSPNAIKKPQGQALPPLVINKIFVKIERLEHDECNAVLTFDDGHQSGHYSAIYLRQLCEEQDVLWRDYLARLNYAKQLKDNAIPLVVND